LPPFITSQLQRDASTKLGFNVRRTMGVAQRLYEGIDLGAEGTTGLITYMRTDSPRVSPDAIQGAREWIGRQLGARYLPDTPNVYKGKKDAQDAHEAIRPTDASRTPESMARLLSEEQLKLYTLIWRRFMASQMTPAIFDITTAKIAAVSAKDGKVYDFRVSGSVQRFDGFLRLYEVAEEKKDEDDESSNKLPNLDGVKALALEKLDTDQKFTQPPPRFNEASLVKVLEEKGIGRPSTYASIINTIQDREYVTKISGRFYPTEIGMVVCDLLVESFPYIFDIAYTAKLEEELDDIEDGKEKWTDLMKGFYDYFEDELKDADKNMRSIKRMVRVMRVAAGFEVGEVWQLLLLFELQQEQAGNHCDGTMEEGSEGSCQESYDGAGFSDDCSRASRGRQRLLESGGGRKGAGCCYYRGGR
jgi:DNA topoisomerase-1